LKVRHNANVILSWLNYKKKSINRKEREVIAKDAKDKHFAIGDVLAIQWLVT
jgi:hypothetical protein